MFLFVTHGNNNLPIPAIAYFINTLDIKSSGSREGPGAGKHFCMLGTFFIIITEPTFKNFPSNGFSGETFNFAKKFYVIRALHIILESKTQKNFKWKYVH